MFQMNSDEQEIRQLVATWIDATKTGDTDTVLSLMADDVVFLVTGQPPMIGKSGVRGGHAGAVRARAAAIRWQERDSGDPSARRLGLYVD